MLYNLVAAWQIYPKVKLVVFLMVLRQNNWILECNWREDLLEYIQCFHHYCWIASTFMIISKWPEAKTNFDSGHFMSWSLLCNSLWRRGVVVTTTTQLHSTKSELGFCAGWNTAWGVSDFLDGQNLWHWT